MLKTTSITKMLEEKLKSIGAEKDHEYSFKLYTETGKVNNGGLCIKGSVRRVNASHPAVAGIKENMYTYMLDLIVPTWSGENQHVVFVNDVLDTLISDLNGTYADIDEGRAKILIDGGVVQSGIEKQGIIGDAVILSVNVNIEWQPHVKASTEELKENEIEILLIKRTPYHNRTIDMNEEDNVVFRLVTTIIGWQHDEVSAVLKMKLPAIFDAEYNYIQVTEYNGRVTRWFVMQRDYVEPSVYIHQLKRDVIRENWNSISNAYCEIERGYLNSSSPLFYKSEGLSGNLTLGRRSKLINSNLMLAYVKTFNIANNAGSAIPEGYWKVQGGMPGFNNAPIITETIPAKISLYDSIDNQNKNGYINIRAYWHTNIVDDYYKSVDSNGNYGTTGASGYNFTDNGNPCGTGVSSPPTQNVLNMVKNSVSGYAEYVSDKLNLNLSNIPSWMKETRGFGGAGNNVYPSSYECVINKGTEESPQYYKLIFTNTEKTVSYNIDSNNTADIQSFIAKTGQSWGTKYNGYAAYENIVEGNIVYHEYTIEQLFLSSTPASHEACYTQFPATSIQTTAGAFSYNIFAFKVFDNGIGITTNYSATVQGNSGQMIASALMGIGVGVPADIPSLSGQIIDIQMCPFNEDAIYNLIDTVYPIYAGSDTSTKVGEYYLLNSQDIEQFVDYSLDDWNSRGNRKSRVNLSQMRLVCPNNSSMATLNPDILTTKDKLRFKVNGTLYPYKPIYKVTPVADSTMIYAQQDARDNMLVLGGDFSATQVSSGWSDYLIGNKNVEEVQQSSIANQTMNQQLQYDFQLKSINQNANLSMLSSWLGIGGGLAGFSLKNPMMGILGLIGGGMGLLGTGTSTQLQKESLQISQNVFNNNIALNQKLFSLQMGNIKALPNTIHKITSGSFDNDYSIIIEEYYSTNLEYEEFDKVIKKIGMSINCMGSIIDYLHPEYFIFAQMIECENINNFHEFDEINRELQNGLRIIYE